MHARHQRHHQHGSGNYKAGTYTITPSAATGSAVQRHQLHHHLRHRPDRPDSAPRRLTDTGFAVNNKTYDSTTTATISSNGSLTGGGSTPRRRQVHTGDTVSIATGGSATFGSANAGSQTATGSLTLTGSDAANYTLTAPTATATIAAEAITITATNQNQTYGFGDTQPRWAPPATPSPAALCRPATHHRRDAVHQRRHQRLRQLQAGTYNLTPSSATGSGGFNGHQLQHHLRHRPTPGVAAEGPDRLLASP